MDIAMCLSFKLYFMANNPHQSHIVFTLNNTGEYHNRSALVFITVQILLGLVGTSTKNYIEGLGYFTERDLLLLHDRILNKRNKEVAMNEKHFIIYNAAFHCVKKLLLDEYCQDVLILKEAHGFVLDKSIFHVKTLMLEFIEVGEKLFKTEYKNNHSLTIALTKIANS